MHLLFQTLLGATLLFAPLYTQRIARATHDWEDLQIQLDNVAIRLSQNDRTLLHFVEKHNRYLATLEKAHHTAHACAHSTGAPHCIATDKSLEVAIGLSYEGLYAATSFRWKQTTVKAQTELRRAGHGRLVRDPFPFHGRRCSTCGLLVELMPRPQRLSTTIQGDPKRYLSVATSLEYRQNRWEYRLHE